MSIEALNGFKMPKIVFTTKAITWVTAMVEAHTDEVGFYCTVDKDGDIYTITDVFYPKHDLATAVTCEISMDGLADIGNYLLDNNREDDISKLKVWGHSHHTMGVSPSDQDEKTGLELANDNGDYLIRLIANKKGDMNVTFYDMINKVRYTKMGYSVHPTNDESYPVVCDIVDVLNNADLDNSTKLLMISDIIEQGVEDDYENILAKVKVMKGVNIPKAKYYAFTSEGKKPVVNHNTAIANKLSSRANHAKFTTKEEMAFEAELALEQEMLMNGAGMSMSEIDREFDAIEEFNSGGINERFQ